VRSGILVGIVAALVVASCGSPQKTQTYVAAPESWCPDGFEQGPDDACFMLPEQRGDKTAVLVYLHNNYKGAGPTDEWEVVKHATEKGYAVVLARGRRALCGLAGTGDNEFCWPSDPEDQQTMKSLAASWDKTIWQADALLENGPHKHYVLGYGTGGAFAGTLATQGFLEASGYADIGAGATMPSPAAGRKPVLVVLASGDADGDGATQAKSFNEVLDRTSWSHAKCNHAQHALTKDDLDMVLKTFSRERSGEISAFPGSGSHASPCDPPATAAATAPKKK
jgi:poly(3-hydroxybutyrate) depolymerase